MNPRVVRLIAAREFTDLFRDRRSVFLLVLLPILLYPGFGVAGYYFALKQLEHVSRIGIAGAEYLPSDALDADSVPPLIVDDHFAKAYCENSLKNNQFDVTRLQSADLALLENKTIDVLVIVPSDFKTAISEGRSAIIEIKNRDGDDISKLATQRVSNVLHNYADHIKVKRFARRGLPADFDTPLLVREPKDDESVVQRTSAELRDQLAKFFPFMLVMWALAGALHPAIDLCAGEKERGTMETLLISPAERGEIVAGKFIAVWGYATATAWWNLVWMAGLCLAGGWFLEVTLLRPVSLIACFALSLLMTALFSSLSLAIGAYARSTKEGQYYLLPLFLGVMPLVLLSMAPNAELSIGTCLIPITGLCLLLQKMIGPTPWREVLPYLIPVFISLMLCVLLSAWWAVRQFHREEVLFRETDLSPIRGWMKSFSSPAAADPSLRPVD